MRLCIIASGDFFSTYGGGQVYVKNLVDELILHHSEIDLSVISFDDSFPFQARKREYQGIKVYEISPNGHVALLLETICPDVVHAHGEKALSASLCQKLHIRCVITAHHGGILCPAGSLLNDHDEICHTKACFSQCLPCYLRNIRSGLMWFPLVKHIPYKHYLHLGKLLQRVPFIPFITPIFQAAQSIRDRLEQWNCINDNANLIVAPSKAIADSMILNGADPHKVTIISHGIPLPDKTYPFPSSLDPIRFYYVGRICYVKGIHILLAAFHQITNSRCELHLIGGASNKTEHRYMRQLQQKFKCDNRIVWHGKVDADLLPEKIKDYHVLVHPTICMEIFGLDIAEALVQHKYVVATRCGGAEMQIHDKTDGALVEPNNVAQLYSEMNAYLNAPQRSSSDVKSIQTHCDELIQTYHTAD